MPTPATYSDSYVYDDDGRLSQKGGSTYTYDTSHPHAASQAHGWTYSYNNNGDVISKTDGVDTYTFTYTRELKVRTISLNAQVLHTFGYDANGNRVVERRSDGTLVFFVGGYYEYSVRGAETHTTKYYGSEAMRVDNDLHFILMDHLGSTSIVTDANGENPIEQRYDAWGKTRYTDGVIPTDKEYTGQRHSRDIGLYDYKASWGACPERQRRNPLLGRFLMEDQIIPNQGVMRLDRYAYVLNNPAIFIDPSGHLCFDVGNNKICSQDHDEESKYYWNPGYTWIDYEDLSSEKGYKTGISAEDVYNNYIYAWSNENNWGRKAFGNDSDGFTIWDYLAVMAYNEAGYDTSFAITMAEAGVRFFYERAETLSLPTSVEYLLDWWARFSESNARLIKNNRQPTLYSPLNDARKIGVFGRSFQRPPSAWQQGWASDRPFNWGNASILSVDTVNMYDANKQALFKRIPGPKPGDTFYIPSGCAWLNWQSRSNYGVSCPSVP